MSLLTERLPCEVEVAGLAWPIDTDFRLMVEFETAIFTQQGDDLAELLAELLTRFYCGQLPEDIEAAMDRLLWFYRCGEQEEEKEAKGGKAKRVYDFDQDAEALYTSFLHAYQLDLTTATIHWWQFRRLMFGLPAETPFSRRLHYRTADTSGMGKEERKRYAKLRNLYAIRERPGKRETLEERNARMQAYVRRRFMEVEDGSAKKG